ncbi:hypothetical protein GGD66_005673 [Bradyrhizobium sp. CIR48]|uniref:hypothetical protein n=1 Tax=Bradyrhizobium sp. CIR48 TaxID=2663840 RepID=UPI001605A791|nr:hypothetical protein [Bradyrhizobium sp. CIR48]MBB4427097.1 hypothetical protein [Bradyrhizobium sp. CIR48]
MNIPSLEEVSPEYAAGIKKAEALNERIRQCQYDYRHLTDQKINGAHNNHEARVQAMLDDKPPVPVSHIDTLLEDVRAVHDAASDALHIQTGSNAALGREAGRKLCERLKPLHDSAMKEISNGLLAVHKGLVTLHRLRNGLLSAGAGFHGLFNVSMPDDLERPLDRSSSLGDYFRAARANGFIKSVPEELR